MNPEPSDFAQRLAERKESARSTLRPVSNEELRNLVAELFPEHGETHPFMEAFTRFIDEHHSEQALRGETSDKVGFVYYPQSNRGMWFLHVGHKTDVGLLGTTSLKNLAEISAEYKTGRT
ncbi:MAG: hypothetical protein JOY96_09105 [Verrucomicrobia bacterium]|nr:hypothetical protein [Verrucomicrobiota bacterium]